MKKWDIDFDVADLSVYPLIENKLVSIEKEYYSFYREIRELYYEYYYVTFSSGIIQLYTGVELLSIFSGNFEFLDDRVYLKVNEESYLIENLKFIDKSLGKIVIIEGDEDFYFYDELETLPLPELEDIYLIFKYYESNYGEVKTLEDLKIPNYVSSVYLYPIYDIIGLEEIKEIALTKYFKMFDYFGYEVYFDFIDNKIISQNFLIEFINEEVKINFDDGLEVILPNDNNIKYEFLSDILYNELNYFFSGYIGEYITLYKILNGDLIYDEFNDYNYRKQYLFDDEYLEITEWGIEYLFFDLEIVDDYDVLFYYGSQESNALFNFYTNYDDDITFNIYKYSYISPDLFVNLYKDKAFKGVYLDEDYLEEYDFDDYSIKTFYLLYEELKAPEEIISDLLNKKMLTLFCNYYLTYKYFDDHIEVYKYDELIGYDDFLTETNYFKLGDVWFKNEEELTNFRMLLTNLTNEDFINKGSYYLYQSDEYEIYLYADFFEIYDYDSYDNYDYSLEVFEPTTIDLEELNAVVMPTGKGKAIVIDEDYERFYIIEDLMELPNTEPYNDFVYFTHYYYNNYGIDIYTLEDLLDIKTNETIIYLTSEYYQKELSHLINYVKDYKYIKFEDDILAYYELETNIIYGENFEIEIRNNSIKVSLDGHSPFVVEDTKSKTYVEIDKEIDEKLDIYFYLNDILLFVDIINEEVELDDSYYLSYIFKNFYDENNYNYSAIMYHHELLHFEYFAIEFLNSYSFD